MADNNQDINQLLKVRREKLAELQEQGNDPFTITKYDVTHHSQEIKDQFDELDIHSRLRTITSSLKERMFPSQAV